MYNENSFFERLNAARQARKELLEKFHARTTEDEEKALKRKEKRQIILDMRALRAAEKEKRKKEKLAQEMEIRKKEEAECEALRLKMEAEIGELAILREKEEKKAIAAQLLLEAEQKIKRDARYAARKVRGRRLPPQRS